MPSLSARVRLRFGPATDEWYAMQGSAEDIAAEIRAWTELGVEHLAMWVETTDPAVLEGTIDRFVAEVLPLV